MSKKAGRRYEGCFFSIRIMSNQVSEERYPVIANGRSSAIVRMLEDNYSIDDDMLYERVCALFEELTGDSISVEEITSVGNVSDEVSGTITNMLRRCFGGRKVGR